MTTYDDRQKGFERKFAHDEEIAFKTMARRNKLLGLWAAAKLGKQGEEAEQYAKDVVMADFEHDGDDDVLSKVAKDFAQAEISITEKDIRVEMERLIPIAREQVEQSRKES